MKSVLIVLLMLITHAQLSTSCPASCVVCSGDAIVCHKLSSVIEVPNTIKILLLTDGLIQLIDGSTLSGLSNITLLGLSGNIISNIMENAFHNLTLLRTLLLDHNRITSFSIHNSTFTKLQNLEVLQLGNNAIQEIKSSWFQGLQSLLILHLEGNLITRLTSDTFQSSNLDNLETLDLSDNLIEFLAKGSFHGLPRLRSLDVSRNNLRSAPDAFSYLSWLSALNLDLNEWNCTCELRELSSFLSSYIQAPDKVLYNGRQMVCLSTANPAVQTILQLTEANCVPPNQNITVLIKAENRISMKHYARDISLAAFFFFLGGVGVTMVVISIIYSKSRLTKNTRSWRDWNCGEVEEELQNEGSPRCTFTGDRGVQILTITHPGQEAKSMLPNSEKQAKPRAWLGESGLANTRVARPEHHFSCHQCSLQRSAPMSMKCSSEADASRTTALHNLIQTQPHTHSRFAVVEQNRRHVALPLLKTNADFRIQGHYQKSKCLQHSLHAGEKSVLACQRLNTAGEPERSQDVMGHSASSDKDMQFQTQRQMERRASESLRSENGLRLEVESAGTMPECLTLTCAHCQQDSMYMLEGRKDSSWTEEMSTKDNSEDMQRPYNLATRLYKEDNTNVLNVHEEMRGHRQKRAGFQRNVTFNLTEADMAAATAQTFQKAKNYDGQIMLQDEAMWNGGKRSLRSDKRVKLVTKSVHKHEGQSSGLLKVKIDLNPFKKSRVHPKNKSEVSPGNTLERSVKNKKMRKGDWDAGVSEAREKDTQPKEEMKKRKRAKGQTDEEKKVNHTQSSRKSHDLTLEAQLSISKNKDKMQDSIKQPAYQDIEPDIKSELDSKQGQNMFLETEAEKSQGTEDIKLPGDRSAESAKITQLSDILSMSTNEPQNAFLELKGNGDKLGAQGGKHLEFLQEPSKAGAETDQHIDTENSNCPSLGLQRIPSNSSQLQSINRPNDASLVGGEKEVQVSSNVHPNQNFELKTLHKGENTGAGVVQEIGQSTHIESIAPISHEMEEASTSSFKNENKQNTTLDGGLPNGSSPGSTPFIQPPFQGPQDSAALLVVQANNAELLYSQVPPGEESTTKLHNEEPLSGSHLLKDSPNGENISNNNSMDPAAMGVTLLEGQIPSAEGSPKRKICLILPEKNNRPKTGLEKKIR